MVAMEPGRAETAIVCRMHARDEPQAAIGKTRSVSSTLTHAETKPEKEASGSSPEPGGSEGGIGGIGGYGEMDEELTGTTPMG